MQTGIYRKVGGNSGIGKLYLLLTPARHHNVNNTEPLVVYIPLRVEPEWAGTVRPCVIPRAEFDEKFAFVGEGLPDPVERQ